MKTFNVTVFTLLFLFSCKERCTSKYFAEGYNEKIIKREHTGNQVKIYTKNDYFIIDKKTDDGKDSIKLYDCYCGKEYYGTFLK